MSRFSDTDVSAFSDSNTNFIGEVESKYLATFNILTSKLLHSKLLSYFALFLNLIQTTFINFYWNFNFGPITSEISKYFGFVTRQWIFSEKNFETFIVVIIFAFILLLLLVSLFFYVLQLDEISSTLKTLVRTLLFLLTHAFFVPLTSIFLTTFECNFETYHLQVYPTVHCYLFPNTTTIGFAGFGLIFLLFLSFGSQLL
jgi:hypothetical protein